MDKEEINRIVERLLKKLRVFLKRYPFHNIALLMVFAPLGYLFPLIFPLLAFYSSAGIVTAVIHAPALGWPSVLDWWPVFLWVIALVVSLWVSYRLACIRPKDPVGLPLTAAQAPKLFSLLDEMKTVRGQMPIHRVIVTERFELDIVKTRVTILPVWSRNTLVIGLPLMQMMPPNAYRAMMARKLSQHSLLRNPLLHWFHQLNAAWSQYHACMLGRRAPDMQMMELFYRFYSLLYAKLVEPVARLDGLSADSYTLKVINDEDIVESIEYLFVAGMFIEKIFWPKLRAVARKQRNYQLFPFATLGKIGLSSLARLNVNKWLIKEMASGSSPRWGVASMPVRLDGLGHDELFDLEVTTESAAKQFLGVRLKQIVTVIDRHWQKKTMPEWREADDKVRREHALMATLKAKFKSRDYSFSELRQYFRLALRLHFHPALKLLFKMFFLTRIRLFGRRRMAIA